jgi:hypothetical protein
MGHGAIPVSNHLLAKIAPEFALDKHLLFRRHMGVLTGAAGADDSASPLDARHNMEDETYR